jgi:DNA-binding transcriptional ArsR family regulator
MDPVELRRHLLGKYAWSWCTLAGEDTIERAASGDAVAGRALLGQTRYYGGHALASLSVLVPLDPVETKQRLATAIATAARSLAAREGLEDEIERAAADASAALDTALLGEAIERVTQGYRYVPEPEAERVLLIPHVEPEPWLALAQHRSTRRILFRARPSEGLAERATALGRALADPKRVEILTLLARGTDRVSGLVTVTGLTRSTVHHHLSQLREAGLVELEGNARAYRYAVAGDALPETVALLSDLLAAPGGETG